MKALLAPIGWWARLACACDSQQLPVAPLELFQLLLLGLVKGTQTLGIGIHLHDQTFPVLVTEADVVMPISLGEELQ